MAASKMSAQDYARTRNKTCVTCRKIYYSSFQACPFCPQPAIVAAPVPPASPSAAAESEIADQDPIVVAAAPPAAESAPIADQDPIAVASPPPPDSEEILDPAPIAPKSSPFLPGRKRR